MFQDIAWMEKVRTLRNLLRRKNPGMTRYWERITLSNGIHFAVYLSKTMTIPFALIITSVSVNTFIFNSLIDSGC